MKQYPDSCRQVKERLSAPEAPRLQLLVLLLSNPESIGAAAGAESTLPGREGGDQCLETDVSRCAESLNTKAGREDQMQVGALWGEGLAWGYGGCERGDL